MAGVSAEVFYFTDTLNMLQVKIICLKTIDDFSRVSASSLFLSARGTFTEW